MLRSWRIAGGPKDNRDIEGTSPLTSFGALRAMPSPASYGRVRFDLTNQSKNGRARRRRRGRERFADSQTSPHLFPCPPFPPCPPCDALPLLPYGRVRFTLTNQSKNGRARRRRRGRERFEMARRLPSPLSVPSVRCPSPASLRESTLHPYQPNPKTAEHDDDDEDENDSQIARRLPSPLSVPSVSSVPSVRCLSPASYGRVRFALTNQSKNGRARRRGRGREGLGVGQTSSPHLFRCPPYDAFRSLSMLF
jgi:hypothetical protein